MLEFLAKNAIWISIIIIIFALLYEYRQNPRQIKKKLYDIALLIASAFLAVALAFEQSNYDRGQQRLQEAQTIVISGSMSLAIALKEVAKILQYKAIGLNLNYSENWFQVPDLLEKMITEEKVMTAIGRPSATIIMEGIATMRSSNDYAKRYYPEGFGGAEVTDNNMKCSIDQIIGKHLIAVSSILHEACRFVKDKGRERPDFLNYLAITIGEQNDKDGPLLIENCKVILNHQVNGPLAKHLLNVQEVMDGKNDICMPY